MTRHFYGKRKAKRDYAGYSSEELQRHLQRIREIRKPYEEEGADISTWHGYACWCFGETFDGIEAAILSHPNYRPATIQEEVKEVQGMMVGAAERYSLPARFQVKDGPEGNCVILADNQTGRECVVGLCNYGGVRQVLSAFFSEE
jgi:hypothetical protein